MGDHLGQAIDRLYQAVVDDPDSWSDEALAAWLTEIAADRPVDGRSAKWLRAGVRNARKLRRRAAESPGLDWQLTVDQVLGSRGWEPALRLAQLQLEASPDPEHYADVARRYRSVHFQPWQEGRSYEDWLAERITPGEG